MKKIHYYIICLATVTLSLAACQEIEDPTPLAPTISTPDVLAVGTDYAFFDSITVDDEYVESTYYYVSLSKDMSDAYKAWERDTLWDLTHSQTYYYVACASYGIGEVRGEVKSFETLIAYELSVDDDSDIDSWSGNNESDTTDFDVSENGTNVNGYVAVDLGLSVLWAECNIGADSQEEAGNFYAWGMTTTQSSYSSSNCATFEVEVDDFSGDVDYDAARAVMGGTWRVPTIDEMDELVDECSWTYTTINSVPGYKVTGSNGNSIFLPIRGYYSGSSHMSPSAHGAYWTSTPYPNTTLRQAWNIAMTSSYHRTEAAYRPNGHLIRPVTY